MSELRTEEINIGTTLVLILQLFLTITALIGFVLYLWYLRSSDDQSQSRLLNILNGYLSLTCLGFCLTLLPNVLQLQLKQDEPYLFLIALRIIAIYIIAVSTIFLLISWATILSHFKPGLYLDISVSWNHKIAIPSLILSFILAEQAVNFSCPEKFLICEGFRLRTLVMIPATLTSFLCQLLVIIDDIWGWRNIYSRIRGLCRQNLVTPANLGDIELSEQQNSYDPALGLDQHLVSYFIFW